MRLASLQPSIALTLASLNRLDSLCAVTKYCVAALPALRERHLPVLSDAWSFDRSPEATTELLLSRPDLVVAAIPYRQESLAAILKSGLPVLALSPRRLADIEQNTLLLARMVDAVPEAETLCHTLRSALTHTQERCRQLSSPLVYCEEWGKPLIHSQAWVRELVATANGRFLGEPGAQTSAHAVAAADPDVLLLAWCGAGDRVPIERVIERRGWQDLRAVRERRVFCIPDELLNTPSFNLLEGLQAIAAALHPDYMPGFPRLRQLTP